MATIRMSGGQTFDVIQSFEELSAIVASGWTGTINVTDRSTNTDFTVAVPGVVAVQP